MVEHAQNLSLLYCCMHGYDSEDDFRSHHHTIYEWAGGVLPLPKLDLCKKKSWILPEDLITINMCLLLSGEGTSPYGDLGVSSLLPQEIFIFSTSEMSFPTFCCKQLRKNLIKTWKNAECIPKTPVVHWYAYSMNPGPVRMWCKNVRFLPC